MPQLHRVALRMTGRVEIAQDIAQDAAVKILQSAESLRDTSKFASWAYRITVNCVRGHWRKSRAYDCRIAEYDDNRGLASGFHPNQLDSLIRMEESKHLKELLKDFPQTWQDAFALTQLDGYSYDEAAEILGIARGTVCSSVARLKTQILQKHRQLFAE